MMIRRLIYALLCASALACATSAFERAERDGTADAWRRFLLEHPDDARAADARERLSEAEFVAARRVHTVLGYKRFLESWPGSRRAGDARLLLEGLRFEAAERANTAPAWLDFLREHPSGAKAEAARSRLEAIDWQTASAPAASEDVLESFLSRHPASERRAEAERLLDARRFASARAAGPAALVAYLRQNPSGARRPEAQDALAARHAMALAKTGDLAGARRGAEAVGDPDARAAALQEIDRLELDDATAQLDPRALEAFAILRAGSTAAVEAKVRRAALAGAAGRERLRATAARLDWRRWGRTEDDLRAVLRGTDARERWLAARELGALGAHEAFDALLDATAQARFVRIRAEAFAALQQLLAPLDPETRLLTLERRSRALDPIAVTSSLLIQRAVVDELAGDCAAAIPLYERALASAPGDLFARRRLAESRAATGAWLSAAAEARTLAKGVLALIEERGQETGLDSALAARTLCGARDAARAAQALLERLPSTAVGAAADDLAAYRGLARQAVEVAEATLRQAEAAAAASKPFAACDDDAGLAARLADGERERVEAVVALGAVKERRLVEVALRRTADRDPSARVREAARRALEAALPGAARPRTVTGG